MSQNQADTLGWGQQDEFSHRQFDADLLHEIKSDSDFKYELPPEARPNLLQMIFQKLFEWLVTVLGNEVFAWLAIIVLVIIGVVGLGFAVYGLFGVGKTVPVFVKETGGIDYEVKEEDIHEINFTEEIEAAMGGKDYRRAIRLLYLFALKQLTDREIIAWAPYKTNHDYLLEIQPEAYREQLGTLGYYFEYAWYGHFKVEANHVKEMQEAFAGLEGQLKNG